MKTILSAFTALAIIAGSTAAFAESGDAPQTSQPITPAHEVFASATLPSDTNDAALPSFDGHPVEIAQNDLLPVDGDHGIVQSANSAPAGFADGTLAMITAKSINQAPFFGALTIR